MTQRPEGSMLQSQCISRPERVQSGMCAGAFDRAREVIERFQSGNNHVQATFTAANVGAASRENRRHACRYLGLKRRNGIRVLLQNDLAITVAAAESNIRHRTHTLVSANANCHQ